MAVRTINSSVSASFPGAAAVFSPRALYRVPGFRPSFRVINAIVSAPAAPIAKVRPCATPCISRGANDPTPASSSGPSSAPFHTYAAVASSAVCGDGNGRDTSAVSQ